MFDYLDELRWILHKFWVYWGPPTAHDMTNWFLFNISYDFCTDWKMRTDAIFWLFLVPGRINTKWAFHCYQLMSRLVAASNMSRNRPSIKRPNCHGTVSVLGPLADRRSHWSTFTGKLDEHTLTLWSTFDPSIRKSLTGLFVFFRNADRLPGQWGERNPLRAMDERTAAKLNEGVGSLRGTWLYDFALCVFVSNWIRDRTLRGF